MFHKHEILWIFCILNFTNTLSSWVYSQEKRNKFEHQITSIKTEESLTTNMYLTKGQEYKEKDFFAASQILGKGKSLMKRFHTQSGFSYLLGRKEIWLEGRRRGEEFG